MLSPEENDFVLALSHKFARTKKQMWIGLKRWIQNNGYHWTDGSQARHFTNWAKGEPNFYKKKEYCVQMYTDIKSMNLYKLAGTWNDYYCIPVNRNYMAGTVCEKLA